MPADDYLLGRDSTETERLNYQQQVFARSLNYTVYPSARQQISNSSRIADIGTGTGIYLLDIVDDLPSSCQLDGFDISDAQFPSDLPSNILLIVHDIREPFAPKYHAQYDFVHLRLLWVALDLWQYEMAVKNCIDLLKPGGMIQWVEPDISTVNAYRSRSFVAPTAMLEILSKFRESMGDRAKFNPSSLAGIYQNQGLLHIVDDIVSSDADAKMRQQHNITTGGAFLARLKMVASQSSALITKEKLAELTEQYEKENEAGAYYRMDLHAVVGTKPV